MPDDFDFGLEGLGEEEAGAPVEGDIAQEEKSGSAEMAPASVQQNTSLAKNDPFDFGALMSMPGVVVGDVGLEVSRFPVERAKFTTSSRALISIVSSRVVVIKTHYSEALGNYLCFGGRCCEVDGLAKVRYLFPIVQYDTDKRGKPISRDVTFKVLALGKDSYDDVRTIMELSGDISNFDLVVTCKDEQYQKISLAQAGEARWKKSREVSKQVVDFWREHMKDMILPVARTMTPEDFAKKMAADSAVEASSSTDVDYDALFKD